MSRDEPQALPGFEAFVTRAVDRAGAQNLTGARYTALNVLRDYPETFRSIAAAIFKYNLPNRVIRDLYHVNGMTVKGIHDMVVGACEQDGARGAFLVKCRAASSRSIVQSRILDALIDKLDDPKIVKEMSVSELVAALRSIEPPTAKGASEDASKMTVQVVEPDANFEDLIDGLVPEKTRATTVRTVENDADFTAENGAESSTRSEPQHTGSIPQSHAQAKMHGNSSALCNNLCQGGIAAGNSGDSATKRPVPPTSALAPPTGGGGSPGVLARGAVN